MAPGSRSRRSVPAADDRLAASPAGLAADGRVGLVAQEPGPATALIVVFSANGTGGRGVVAHDRVLVASGSTTPAGARLTTATKTADLGTRLTESTRRAMPFWQGSRALKPIGTFYGLLSNL